MSWKDTVDQASNLRKFCPHRNTSIDGIDAACLKTVEGNTLKDPYLHSNQRTCQVNKIFLLSIILIRTP